MMIAKALAKSAGSSLLLMVLVNGETTSAPDVGRAGEECLVVQGLPLQVQLNNGASGKFHG